MHPLNLIILAGNQVRGRLSVFNILEYSIRGVLIKWGNTVLSMLTFTPTSKSGFKMFPVSTLDIDIDIVELELHKRTSFENELEIRKYFRNYVTYIEFWAAL